jgi:hypothetical protein
MPETADKILGVLGGKKVQTWLQELDWGSTLAGNPVSQSLVLFPRATP